MRPRKYFAKVGDVFGSWTVVGSEQWSPSQNCYVVKCRCACGRTADVTVGNLCRGRSTKCRPCHAMVNMSKMRARRSYVTRHRPGQRYGRWTLVERTSPLSKAPIKYRVRCDCGFEAERAVVHLYTGRSKMCVGCRRKVWEETTVEKKRIRKAISLYKRSERWALLPDGQRINLSAIAELWPVTYQRVHQIYQRLVRDGYEAEKIVRVLERLDPIPWTPKKPGRKPKTLPFVGTMVAV